jgi:hypothetical protein
MVSKQFTTKGGKKVEIWGTPRSLLFREKVYNTFINTHKRHPYLSHGAVCKETADRLNITKERVYQIVRQDFGVQPWIVERKKS